MIRTTLKPHLLQGPCTATQQAPTPMPMDGLARCRQQLAISDARRRLGRRRLARIATPCNRVRSCTLQGLLQGTEFSSRSIHSFMGSWSTTQQRHAAQHRAAGRISSCCVPKARHLACRRRSSCGSFGFVALCSPSGHRLYRSWASIHGSAFHSEHCSRLACWAWDRHDPAKMPETSPSAACPCRSKQGFGVQAAL